MRTVAVYGDTFDVFTAEVTACYVTSVDDEAAQAVAPGTVGECCAVEAGSYN